MKKILFIVSLLSITSLYTANHNKKPIAYFIDSNKVDRTPLFKQIEAERCGKYCAAKGGGRKRNLPKNSSSCRTKLFVFNNDNNDDNDGFNGFGGSLTR